jgi:hypothetical protein
MTSHVCKENTREIVDLVKRLHKAGVGKSSNAVAYSKFLGRTKAQLATFDPESSAYVDYAARDLERSQKAAAARDLKKQSKPRDDAPVAKATTDKQKLAPPPKAKRKEPPVANPEPSSVKHKKTKKDV